MNCTYPPAHEPSRCLCCGSAAADVLSKTQVFSLENFVVHLFPRSIFEALAQNEILQIVIFSILFGVATAGLGENGKVIVKGLDAVAHAILKMVGYVMNVAPLGVFGAIAAVIATKGLGIFYFYGTTDNTNLRVITNINGSMYGGQLAVTYLSSS